MRFGSWLGECGPLIGFRGRKPQISKAGVERRQSSGNFDVIIRDARHDRLQPGEREHPLELTPNPSPPMKTRGCADSSMQERSAFPSRI